MCPKLVHLLTNSCRRQLRLNSLVKSSLVFVLVSGAPQWRIVPLILYLYLYTLSLIVLLLSYSVATSLTATNEWSA